MYQLSPEELQNYIKTFFGWHPLLARLTKSFLHHVEHSLDITELTVELTAPHAVKAFLNEYMPGGVFNFISCIRKFIGAKTKRIYVDDHLLVQSTHAIKIATHIFWNLQKALKSVRPYHHFIIHSPEDARFSEVTNDWGITPNFTLFPFEHLPSSRWHENWVVALYHGNDRRRILVSLAFSALRRAYDKHRERFKKYLRNVAARERLNLHYVRAKNKVELRILAYKLKMDRTKLRIRNLENFIIPGSNN